MSQQSASQGNQNESFGCLASGLAFLLVWIPGVALFLWVVNSETFMRWASLHFGAIAWTIISVFAILAYYWVLVGLFKVMRAGVRAVLRGEMK